MYVGAGDFSVVLVDRERMEDVAEDDRVWLDRV
jgi:hypothetical protein